MRGWIICAFLTLALTCCSAPTQASTPEEMQAQIKALQAQVEQLQKQVAALQRQLADQYLPNSFRYAPFSLTPLPMPPTTQPYFGPMQVNPRRYLPRYNSNIEHEVIPLETRQNQP